MPLKPYEGIYYCVRCDTPIFFADTVDGCECGSFHFISNIDHDIQRLSAELEE